MVVNGITFGCWDLLHTGHVMFLTRCSVRCDNLVIGLHVDPSIERPDKLKPVETVFERFIRLDALQLNHIKRAIFPYEYERDIENMLASFDIHKRFLGADYEGQKVTGEGYMTIKGIEKVFIPRYHQYSTTNLKTRVASQMNEIRAL